MTQELTFQRCIGCGKLSNHVPLLVAIIGDIKLCPECVLTASAIIANQAKEESRIHFVDEMQRIMKEPIATVEKWKEIRAKKPKPPQPEDEHG